MELTNNIVNVINLKHRTDRLESFKTQANIHGFEYRVWEGIIDEPVFKGISRSHKQIIKHAKDNHLPYVIVAEDDLKICDIGAWNYFLSNMPTDFDLYLASVYTGDILPDNRVKYFSGLTLYICHERFYDSFLCANESKHIDRVLGEYHGTFIVCNPFAAIQYDGYSDNVKRNTEYNEKYLTGRNLFTSQTH